MKTSLHFRIALVLVIFITQISFSYAQTYANSESNGANITCVACVVTDAGNAVDGNENTYSTVSLTVGTLGAYVYQKMQYSVEASHGEYLNVVIEGPGVGTLDAAALACLEVTTYNNGVSNNDTKNSTQLTLEQIGATSKYIVKTQPSSTFDEVEMKMLAGSVGAVTQLRIYYSTFSSQPLLVELLYFRASFATSANVLEWSTATETDSDYFTIEKSTNGIHFQELERIKAAGNSNTVLVYHFNDENPLTGNNYYRLKQMDMNGSFHYSSIISVHSRARNINQFAFGPNPLEGFLNLFYSLEADGFVEVKIISLEGYYIYSSIVESRKGLNVLTINDLEDLNPGMYNLYIFSNSEIISKRLIKM